MLLFTLTLVRHGQTKANKDRIIQGQMDVPLSEVGLNQAGHLASRLKNENYTHIYSSDLSRAAETAKTIVKSVDRDVVLQLDERLRERKYGEVEGKSAIEMKRFIKGHSMSFNPSGAETVDQVRERAISFFKELCHSFLNVQTITGTAISSASREISDNKCSYDDKQRLANNVLLVSHGGFIKELIKYFVDDLGCDIPGGKDQASRISPNTGLSKFSVSGNFMEDLNIKCFAIHDQSHLTKIGQTGDNFSL